MVTTIAWNALVLLRGKIYREPFSAGFLFKISHPGDQIYANENIYMGLKCSPIQFLTSGAGSKAWRGDVNVKRLNSDDVKFFYDGQGFMSVQLTQTEAVVVFYDVFGKELHKWEVSKQLYTAM